LSGSFASQRAAKPGLAGAGGPGDDHMLATLDPLAGQEIHDLALVDATPGREVDVLGHRARGFELCRFQQAGDTTILPRRQLRIHEQPEPVVEGHGLIGRTGELEQNERHIQVLREVMASLALPTRLGFAIPPAFQHFVLVSPSARIDRPRHFDTRRAIKADQLRKAIWRDVDNENPLLGILRTAAQFVSSDTLHAVARQLAAMYQPAGDGGSARDARVAATPPPVAQAVEAPPVVEAAAA